MRRPQDDESDVKIYFIHSGDIMNHRRSIYTVLDWLGDVGGLSDALTSIGPVLIFIYTWITGNALDIALVRLVFGKARD